MVWAKPTIHYCENNLSGWVHQPANALSSLLISLTGLYILKRQAHNYSSLLGIVAVILGLASFLYYAADTFAGQLADLGSMFLLASVMVVAASKAKNAIYILAIGTVLPLALTATVKTIGGFNMGIPLFAGLLAAALYFEILNYKASLKFLIYTLVAFAIGYVFWLLDYKKIWCSHTTSHFINGHAVWHLFNAVALLFLDRHYAAKN